jgi:hypothetical protein
LACFDETLGQQLFVSDSRGRTGDAQSAHRRIGGIKDPDRRGSDRDLRLQFLASGAASGSRYRDARGMCWVQLNRRGKPRGVTVSAFSILSA